MPRKPTVRSTEHFYHITARSNNKENFYLPIEEVWRILTTKLGELQKKHQLQIGAFVLMNNHFHLLVLSPKDDIDRIMYFLMKESTIRIQKETGRINKIFGGRYKGSIIEHYHYLLNVYKYIYRNPIAAGIIDRAENYQYSSLHIKLFKKSLAFELHDILLEPGLDWINQSFKENEAKSIKSGLQKTVFQYQKERISRKEIFPEVHQA